MKKYWIPIVFCLAIIRLAKTQTEGSSFWTTSTDVTIGLTAPDTNLEQQIRVFNNEDTKQLSIALPEGLVMDKGLRVQVLDVRGIVLKDQKLKEHQTYINIGDLPLGVYSVRIQSPKMLTEHKMNICRSHNL